MGLLFDIYQTILATRTLNLDCIDFNNYSFYHQIINQRVELNSMSHFIIYLKKKRIKY